MTPEEGSPESGRVLDEILAGVREDVTARQSEAPLERIKELAAAAPAPRDAYALLRAPGVGVIAEVKRASPSRGQIAEIPDAAQLAQEYAAGGARCVSVLTEGRWFGGSLADLAAVRAAVDVPLLRKDFVVDEYQLFEARANGADAVLLIVAALNQAALESLQARAWQLGLATLVEVHDRGELSRAVGSGARVIGVNNRNLRTLKVDVKASDDLAARMPKGIVAVSESGLQSRTDLERLAAAGYGAFLIGERFMTDPDPAAAIRLLIGAPVARG